MQILIEHKFTSYFDLIPAPTFFSTELGSDPYSVPVVLGIRAILLLYLWLMDPDQTPYPTPLFSDFKDVKKIFFLNIFSYNLPTGTSSSVLKIWFLILC